MAPLAEAQRELESSSGFELRIKNASFSHLKSINRAIQDCKNLTFKFIFHFSVLPDFFLHLKISYDHLLYESLILGQLLDITSPAKISIYDPRFKPYDPWDMAN